MKQFPEHLIEAKQEFQRMLPKEMEYHANGIYITTSDGYVDRIKDKGTPEGDVINVVFTKEQFQAFSKKMRPTLSYYGGDEEVDFNTTHDVKLTFLWGEHRAELIATMGGNTAGADLLGSIADLETGLAVRINEPINQKHAIYYEDEEMKDAPYPDVEAIRFFHPTRPDDEIDLDEAAKYLVGVEIIRVTQKED